MMPKLAPSIHFTIIIIDRGLSMLNGTNGRAYRANEIEFSLSSVYDGLADAFAEIQVEYS